jgi:hypothetical protein
MRAVHASSVSSRRAVAMYVRGRADDTSASANSDFPDRIPPSTSARLHVDGDIPVPYGVGSRD